MTDETQFRKDLAAGEHRVLVENALRQILVNQVLIIERIMKSRDNWADEHRQAVEDSRGLIAELE